MLQFIRRLIQPKPKIRVAHPILGELQLEHGANGPYLLREAYHDGELKLQLAAWLNRDRLMKPLGDIALAEFEANCLDNASVGT